MKNLYTSLLVLFFISSCYDYEKTDTTVNKKGKVRYPICICQLNDKGNKFEAFFNFKPKEFDTYSNIKLWTQSCKSLRLCPVIGPKQKQAFWVDGLITLKPIYWNTNTNLLNGNRLFSLEGNIIR